MQTDNIISIYEKMDLERFIYITRKEGLYGFSIGDDKEKVLPDHAGILYNNENDIISIYKTDKYNRYFEVARCLTEEVAFTTLIQILRRRKGQQIAA